MNFNEVITLVKPNWVLNEYGDLVKQTTTTTETSETTRDVFACLKSITQSEFYQSAAVGMKPEIKFVIPDFLDYANEKIVRYSPYGSSEVSEFRVLRTYRDGNRMELVCTRGIDE